MDEDDDEAVRALLCAAYLAGFKASAEGWSGEHGCSDPERDLDWTDKRDSDLNDVWAKAAKAATPQAAPAPDEDGGYDDDDDYDDQDIQFLMDRHRE